MMKKGQSTLEYIVVFAAIVVAAIVIAFTTLRPSVQNVMNSAAGELNNASTNFGALN